MRPTFAKLVGVMLLAGATFTCASADAHWGYGYFWAFHHHPRWGGYGWAPTGCFGPYCPVYGHVAPAPIVCNRSGCGVGAVGNIQPVPAVPPAAGQPGYVPAAPGVPPAATQLDSTSVELIVTVPPEARVFVNGQETQSAGSQRRYFSRGLRPSGRYGYDIRAEVVRDGRTILEARRVEIAAGSRSQVNFELSGDASQVAAANPLTTVVVRVPADAQVFLEGRETAATGSVRRFSSTLVPAGGTWNDYTVRAAIRRNGQLIELERSISLAAGEAREVSFDFDAQRVADVATINR